MKLIKILLVSSLMGFCAMDVTAQKFLSDSTLIYDATVDHIIIPDITKSKLVDGDYVIFYGDDRNEIRYVFSVKNGDFDGYLMEFFINRSLITCLYYCDGKLKYYKSW